MASQQAPVGHEKIETSNFLMIVLVLLTVAVGGLVEIVPLFFQRSTTQPTATLKPYTALQLAGRDVYIREGCYNCHSQMIRPLRFETLRYGDPSTAEESRFDHPFQWGSKRTGPDLAREGGRYPNLWHYRHLLDPRATSPGSNMPPYAFMAGAPLDLSRTADKLTAMRTLGVPYTERDIANAVSDARAQAAEIARDLADNGARVAPDREVLALIAYLQRLGHAPDAATAAAPAAAAATTPAQGAH